MPMAFQSLWLSKVYGFDCFAVCLSLTGVSLPHPSLSGHMRKNPNPHCIQDEENILG